MDIKTLFLYAAFAIVSFSLWTDWKQEHSSIQNQASVEISVPEVKHNAVVDADNNSVQLVQNNLIHIETNVLDVYVDLNQGQVVRANLLKFPLSNKEKHTTFQLFTNNSEHAYFASSQFINMDAGVAKNIPLQYQTKQTEYTLKNDQKELKVVLKAVTEDGIHIHKIFKFKPNSYIIDVGYQLKNRSGKNWKTYLNQQISWKNPEVPESSMFQIGSYTGASYGQPGKHRYKKVSFDQIKKQNLDADAKGGWIAMQQHYFLTAWIPNQQNMNRLYTQVKDNLFIIGAVSEPMIVENNNDLHLNNKLYVGPEDTAVLKTLAPGLDLTVDYGWLWFLSDALFSVMKTIHFVIGNWGWTIVLITFLIKLCFYRLSASSYHSMANMRQLQPKLEQLKQRFGDDKAKFSQATMELYRQEKINPLGGCLPILVQIPVFIALYWVLAESVELRQAPFIFWIKDLSAADPLHILPLFMGLTMFIQQKLNPTQPDPMQAKIMMMMPVFFTILCWSFPSGLVLYWIVNTSLSILQQWWITQKYQSKVTA